MTSYQFDSIQSSSQKILPNPFRVAPCPGAKINVNQTTTSNQQPTAWGISSERVLQNDTQEPKEMASGENPSREQVKARVVDAEMQTRKSKPSPRHA